MKTQDTTLIHPEDSTNIHYWTKKWGVSTRQLNDAILYTGSLNPVRIKEYLRKNSWRRSVAIAFVKLFKAKSNAIH
jgi:hypothetical protein